MVDILATRLVRNYRVAKTVSHVLKAAINARFFTSFEVQNEHKNVISLCLILYVWPN